MADTTIIKEVNDVLVKILASAGTFPVESGPPDQAASMSSSTLLLYLYQVLESPTLKNSGPTSSGLSGGGGTAQSVTVRRDPLALDLYFLIIPATKESSFLDTYLMLGQAGIALHDNGVFTLGDWGAPAEIKDVKLQVTMNPLTTTQLFELWEAVNEPYRLSISYVVRTVRIDSQLSTEMRLVSQRNLQTTQV